jgi:hypothetical protein|tara:strand:- start:1013 stop:1168 length:156 start_codon:yes stop_codon:yes gene_type:complete
MDLQDQNKKIAELSTMIVALKTANQNIHTKQTIQKLQQQIDDLIYEKRTDN